MSCNDTYKMKYPLVFGCARFYYLKQIYFVCWIVCNGNLILDMSEIMLVLMKFGKIWSWNETIYNDHGNPKLLCQQVRRVWSQLYRCDLFTITLCSIDFLPWSLEIPQSSWHLPVYKYFKNAAICKISCISVYFYLSQCIKAHKILINWTK